MTLALPLLNDNDGSEREEPHLFVRTIAARPGAPWDQTRQAALEARIAAPAKLSDVVFRLKRLDPWRPGKEGRFAVVYVRTEDIGLGLVATPTVEGRRLKVSFASPAEQARRAKRIAVIAVAAALVAGLAATVIGAGLARRAQASATLEAAEQLAAARLREGQELQRLTRQTSLLDAEGLRGRRIGEVLADVEWASRVKAPGARIWALHWDHGYVAVEAEGKDSPLSDPSRPLQRSSAPVRPGVFLWGPSSTQPSGSLR